MNPVQLPEKENATYLYLKKNPAQERNEKMINAITGSFVNYMSMLSSVELLGVWTEIFVVYISSFILNQKWLWQICTALKRSLHPLYAKEQFFDDHLPRFVRLKLTTKRETKARSKGDINRKILGFRARVWDKESGEKVKYTEEFNRKLAQFTVTISQALEQKLRGFGFTFLRRTNSSLVPTYYVRKFQDQIQNEILNQQLSLKVGVRVMLRHNLSTTLVNGSMGKVIGFDVYASRKSCLRYVEEGVVAL